MGKGWYKPTVVPQGATLRAGTRKPGMGVRSLRAMNLVGLSSENDVAQLNSYLWDVRNAIMNWELDGKQIFPDSISSTQIARKSIAASCLADDLIFDQNLTITGYLSTGGAVFAGSGIYAVGDISASGNVSGDDFVATGNLTATDVVAERVIASVVISAYSTANLSVDGDARITGDLTANVISANNGFETAASGEFHSGINTAFLSSIDDVVGAGDSLSSVYTTVESDSASWAGGGSAGSAGVVVEQGSAYWHSTHSTVSSNSAYWNSTHQTVSANSSDWEAATTEVENGSANWESVYSDVSTNSSDWEAGTAGIEAGSAYWDSTHQSVSANSAYWMGISSLSGDLQVASLSTSGNVTAASGEFHSGINTSYLSCTGTMGISAIEVTGDLSSGNIVADGDISASGNVSANGAVLAGTVNALSMWPQNGWTGSFTVNGGANTCYVSAGIITGVV